MTVRDVYEAVLIELNKVQAPSLLLNDFVYYINKAIQEYFNKRYNLFEKNQQATDDLSRLNRLATITAITRSNDPVYKTVWTVELPSNYVHILNCTCVFDKERDKCNKDNRTVVQGANKLDTNQASHVLSNYYMQPSIKQPYYYIIYTSDPTNQSLNIPANSNKQAGQRYGNSNQPVMQILCGNDPSITLKQVQIAYLTAPQYITLSQSDLDNPIDSTAEIEFQDYVINEIIKELVKMVLENGSDARIQTFIPVNQSVPQQ